MPPLTPLKGWENESLAAYLLSRFPTATRQQPRLTGTLRRNFKRLIATIATRLLLSSRRRLLCQHPETTVRRDVRTARSFLPPSQSSRSDGSLRDQRHYLRGNIHGTECCLSIEGLSEISPFHRRPVDGQTYRARRSGSID